MQNWETLIAQRTEAHRESYKPQRIAELNAKLAEKESDYKSALKAVSHWHDNYCELQKVVDGLQSKLECKEADTRILKRALWISRAKAYRYIAELIACFNPDYVRNRKMFTPNNLKQKQMNSLKWARLMLKIERKCRAKAEEYK